MKMLQGDKSLHPLHHHPHPTVHMGKSIQFICRHLAAMRTQSIARAAPPTPIRGRPRRGRGLEKMSPRRIGLRALPARGDRKGIDEYLIRPPSVTGYKRSPPRQPQRLPLPHQGPTTITAIVACPRRYFAFQRLASGVQLLKRLLAPPVQLLYGPVTQSLCRSSSLCSVRSSLLTHSSLTGKLPHTLNDGEMDE